MSFTTETQTRIDTIARKIQRVNPTAANRLFRLSAAVGYAPDSMADAWALTNVQQMIDTHAVAAQMRAKDIPPRSLRLLEWLRNLLIFLPLVLTWYGISRAVSSYATFITTLNNNPAADKTQLTQPFLYLWQQGFGGYLPSWLTLSQLALYDFILLALLVILTAIVNIRSHLRTNSKEQAVEVLQEELTDVLADAALCLTTRRGQQPTNVVDLSQQLLDELAKERQRLDDLSTRREKELADLKSFTDALIPISQNMLNGATQVQQATSRLTQTIVDITAPVQHLLTNQQQQLGTLVQLLTTQRETSDNVKQLVNDQKDWGQSLEEAIDDFTTSTRRLDQLPAAITQWTNQLGNLVNQLTIEHKAQTTVSQMTADAALGLQDALKNIHQAANELRSMSNDFFTIMNTQKEFPAAVKLGLNDVIRDYNNAAASVAQGGNNLAYAARMLLDAANRLNGGGNIPMHP
jgi:hypothetical protein